MSIDIDMAEIAQLFVEESVEGLDIMESGLLNLSLGAADAETMNAIFRAAHSIKGGGATFGFNEVSEFAHHVETLMDELRQGLRPVTRPTVDLLLQSVDCIRDMIAALAEGNVDTARAKELEKAIARLMAAPAAAPSDVEAPAAATQQVIGWLIDFAPHAGMLRSCNDPLRIIRELRSLGELEVSCRGADALEFGAFDAEECQLSWQLALCGDVPREEIDDVFAWVSDECDLSIEAIVDEVDEPASAAVAGSNPEVPPVVPTAETTERNEKTASKDQLPKVTGANKESGSIRVRIDKVDDLINLVGELVITQSMLSRFNGDFDFTQIEALRDGLSQLSRNTRELQESVMAIRMLPISFAFSRFPRLVRDTSNVLGKRVELRLTGESTELDKTVLEKIGDPLVHLVRNSLDHGLERPEERVAAGKPETGVLELNAYHEGGNIVIDVIDDGAGINQERVLAKARERGLVGADDQLSPDKINNLIFMPGFSTVDEVSDLSGRGVGMDVVRRNISELGGNVSVVSTPGKGSVFTIRLPLTLAILDGQLIRVGDQSYIIPLVSIIETIQGRHETVSRIAGESELFRVRDEYLPVLRLHQLFNVPPDSDAIEDGLLVVAEAHGQRVGVLVDELLEQQQVVIKSLEKNFRATIGVSGATILGDGTVALIVDMAGLLRLYYERKAGDRSAAA